MSHMPMLGATIEPTLALVILFVMTFVSNGVLPLPITAFVIWLGQFHYPVPVVLVGTLGSVLGWVCWLPILNQWQRNSKAATTTQTDPIRHSPRGILWLTLICNALPLPLDPGRYLAMQSSVTPTYLTSVIAIGRAIRMTLLVSVGTLIAPYQNWFWALVVFFLIFPLVWGGLNKLKQWRAHPVQDAQ